VKSVASIFNEWEVFNTETNRGLLVSVQTACVLGPISDVNNVSVMATSQIKM
jgi:hypothetical protein